MINEQLPAPNIPLLRKAVEWAEAEAAKTDGTGLWNQGVYAMATDCGTAFCIAGFTVASAAPDVQVEPDPTGYGTAAGELMTARRNGVPIAWESEAASLLGLTDSEAWTLFDVDNDITDVRRIAESITARAGERL